jgi:hypothetical protein
MVKDGDDSGKIKGDEPKQLKLDGSEATFEQQHIDFHLTTGRIRVQTKRHGARSYLEVRTLDGTMDVVPYSTTALLLGTRSVAIKPPARTYDRARPRPSTYRYILNRGHKDDKN